VSAFFCVALSCVDSSLVTGRSPVQLFNRFVSFRSQILNRKRPEGLIRIYFTQQENLKRKDHCEDLGVDMEIILERSLR
jgi:hypothetical protein